MALVYGRDSPDVAGHSSRVRVQGVVERHTPLHNPFILTPKINCFMKWNTPLCPLTHWLRQRGRRCAFYDRHREFPPVSLYRFSESSFFLTHFRRRAWAIPIWICPNIVSNIAHASYEMIVRTNHERLPTIFVITKSSWYKGTLPIPFSNR